MAVTKSQIIDDAPQHDGRRWITERHYLDDGTYEDVTYIAGAKDNVVEMLPIRAAQIEERKAVEQQSKDEQATAEKKRVSVLLTLEDQDLADVLMVPVEKIEDEKGKLADVAADVVLDVTN